MNIFTYQTCSPMNVLACVVFLISVRAYAAKESPMELSVDPLEILEGPLKSEYLEKKTRPDLLSFLLTRRPSVLVGECLHKHEDLRKRFLQTRCSGEFNKQQEHLERLPQILSLLQKAGVRLDDFEEPIRVALNRYGDPGAWASREIRHLWGRSWADRLEQRVASRSAAGIAALLSQKKEALSSEEAGVLRSKLSSFEGYLLDEAIALLQLSDQEKTEIYAQANKVQSGNRLGLISASDTGRLEWWLGKDLKERCADNPALLRKRKQEILEGLKKGLREEQQRRSLMGQLEEKLQASVER